MIIYLYKITDDPRHITKRLSETVKTYNLAYATHELDLLKPEIQISDLGLSQFNYMYIPDLARYYYIHPVIMANGFYTLNARCDVLMSHAVAIRSNEGILDRSNNVFTRYLTDPEYEMKVFRRVQTVPFSTTPFDTSADRFYLTCTGGASATPEPESEGG